MLSIIARRLPQSTDQRFALSALPESRIRENVSQFSMGLPIADVRKRTEVTPFSPSLVVGVVTALSPLGNCNRTLTGLKMLADSRIPPVVAVSCGLNLVFC
jgi:hypothetical protein